MNPALKELLEFEDNSHCAECGLKAVNWCSFSEENDFAVFVCSDCAGGHRVMVPSLRVKSLTLDNWGQEEIELLKRLMGNLRANERFEAFLPEFYPKPSPSDPEIVKKNFILAKYDRQEFVKQSNLIKNVHEMKSGILMKRNKAEKEFNSRLFVFEFLPATLKYYQKFDPKTLQPLCEPKRSLRVEDVRFVFRSKLTGHQNGAELSFHDSQGEHHRIFVYSTDEQDIISWWLSLRACQLYRHKTSFPQLSSEQCIALMKSHVISYEGFLFKKGPKEKDRYLKRYCELDTDFFYYYADMLDACPRGCINLAASGVIIEDGVNSGDSAEEDIYFSIKTLDRLYEFRAESAAEKKQWLAQMRYANLAV